ncbi:MAG TPA: hypothetical protein VK137_15485 [Planctomycetaceae bacterium]|nr:hypothetical protein [Planctomycetaceae bacterium]
MWFHRRINWIVSTIVVAALAGCTSAGSTARSPRQVQRVQPWPISPMRAFFAPQPVAPKVVSPQPGTALPMKELLVPLPTLDPRAMPGSSLPNGVTTQSNKPVRELDAAVPPPIRFQPAPLGRSNRSEPVTSPDAEGAGPRLGFEPLPAPHDSPLTLEINGPRQRSVGGAVTYELVVRNGSQQPIDHVVVNVDFDGELIFPGHIEKQVKKDLGNLLPGQSREMKLTLTSNKVGRHACRFEVTADNLDPVWQTATVVYIAR